MSRRIRPGRPLAGVAVRHPSFNRFRVLDFSKLLPGPYATQAMRDLGMAVTTVELPHFQDLGRTLPPLVDGVGFVNWMVNDGKRRLVLDFRKPHGMRRLRRLIERADVLVEGFRPGRMDRLGLGYEELSRLNPRLVYCSLIGYRPDGPMAEKAGHDINFMAASGFLGLADSDGRTAFPGSPVADLCGSVGAVIGVLAALLERETLGRGRRVIVPMAEALHSWLAIPLGYLEAEGRDPVKAGQWWNGGHPFYRLYETRDGGFMAVGALEKGFSLALLDALGLGGLKESADDPTGENGRILAVALAGKFASATRDEWTERLKGKDVCVNPVLSLSEARDAAKSAGPSSASLRSRPGIGPQGAPTSPSKTSGRRPKKS